MITKEEVKHIAKLARLGITPAEVGKLQDELSSILNYVEKLKKVDVSKTEPTSHPFKIENVMRRDEAKPFDAAQGKQKLLSGFLKVKSIFK